MTTLRLTSDDKVILTKAHDNGGSVEIRDGDPDLARADWLRLRRVLYAAGWRTINGTRFFRFGLTTLGIEVAATVGAS